MHAPWSYREFSSWPPHPLHRLSLTDIRPITPHKTPSTMASKHNHIQSPNEENTDPARTLTNAKSCRSQKGSRCNRLLQDANASTTSSDNNNSCIRELEGAFPRPSPSAECLQCTAVLAASQAEVTQLHAHCPAQQDVQLVPSDPRIGRPKNISKVMIAQIGECVEMSKARWNTLRVCLVLSCFHLLTYLSDSHSLCSRGRSSRSDS
jgi:hypothetical protein